MSSVWCRMPIGDAIGAGGLVWRRPVYGFLDLGYGDVRPSNTEAFAKARAFPLHLPVPLASHSHRTFDTDDNFLGIRPQLAHQLLERHVLELAERAPPVIP